MCVLMCVGSCVCGGGRCVWAGVCVALITSDDMQVDQTGLHHLFGAALIKRLPSLGQVCVCAHVCGQLCVWAPITSSSISAVSFSVLTIEMMPKHVLAYSCSRDSPQGLLQL